MPRASHAAFDAAAEVLGVPQNEPAITAMIHELEVEGPYRDTALDLERRRMLAHWREQQQDRDRGEQPTDLSDGPAPDQAQTAEADSSPTSIDLT